MPEEESSDEDSLLSDSGDEAVLIVRGKFQNEVK